MSKSNQLRNISKVKLQKAAAVNDFHRDRRWENPRNIDIQSVSVSKLPYLTEDKVKRAYIREKNYVEIDGDIWDFLLATDRLRIWRTSKQHKFAKNPDLIDSHEILYKDLIGHSPYFDWASITINIARSVIAYYIEKVILAREVWEPELYLSIKAIKYIDYDITLSVLPGDDF